MVLYVLLAKSIPRLESPVPGRPLIVLGYCALQDFASAASDVDDFTQTIMAEKNTDAGVVIEEEKYYKQFLLQPIKLTMTLTNTPGGQLAWLPTLDNFKIHLSSVEISDQTLVGSQLSQNISDLVSKRVLEYMYKGGVIRGIGSLAILGNPEATLTTIAGGFKSLLINPARAAVQGPEEFGKSVATGTVCWLPRVFSSVCHCTF